IPLGATCTINDAIWNPIGKGIRRRTAAISSLTYTQHRHKPDTLSTALGLLDGSRMRRPTGFVDKYAYPEYEAGDTILLYFNPESLHDLFHAASPQPCQH